MNKSFLDRIYYIRVAVVNDINRLDNLLKEPSDNERYDNLLRDGLLGELRTRRSELSSIDEIIQAYLDLYK